MVAVPRGLRAAPYRHGVSARVGACTSLTRFGGLGTTLRHVPECWVLPETPVSPAQPPAVHGPWCRGGTTGHNGARQGTRLPFLPVPRPRREPRDALGGSCLQPACQGHRPVKHLPPEPRQTRGIAANGSLSPVGTAEAGPCCAGVREGLGSSTVPRQGKGSGLGWRWPLSCCVGCAVGCQRAAWTHQLLLQMWHTAGEKKTTSQTKNMLSFSNASPRSSARHLPLCSAPGNCMLQ